MNAKTYRIGIEIFFSLILIVTIFSCDNGAPSITNENKNLKLEQQDFILPLLDSDKVIIEGITDYYDSVYTLTLHTREVYEKLNFDSLRFRVKFEIDRPSIVRISHSAHRAFPIFALPGDSIFIDFKLVDFLNERHTQSYSGTRIRENQALAKLNEILILDNPIYADQFDIDEEAFMAKMDSLEERGRLIFEAYDKKTELSPYFEKCYETFLEYKIVEFMGRYKRNRKKEDDGFDAPLSLVFVNKIESYTKEDSTLLNIYPYLNYLHGMAFSKSEDPQSPTAIFNAIDSSFTNKEIIDQLKYNLVREELRIQGYFRKSFRRYQPKKKSGIRIQKSTRDYKYFDRIEEFMELYRASNPPGKYLKIIEETYDALIK